MAESKETSFLVDPYSDPVILKINGRASYLNSGSLNDLFKRCISLGKKNFIIDFINCTTMDSTFLGIVAALALDVRKISPAGSLTLCRLSNRNLELIKNLGLHRILNVDSGSFNMSFDYDKAKKLASPTDSAAILKAHETLIAIDKSNKKKFQDVVSFLRNQNGNTL